MLRGRLAPLLRHCSELCKPLPLEAAANDSLRLSAPASALTYLQRGFAQAAATQADRGGQDFASSPLNMPGGWQQRTQRSGVIAVKVGMTQEWDSWGARIPLTVLWIDNCQVVQVKRDEKEGYTALQLGCGAKRVKQVNGTELGHFRANGVPIKRKLQEFRVTEEGLLPVGTPLSAAHFTAGQYVDVTGTTIGKGFQGVMKRWGFAGGSASHGNSKAHRLAGSTGGCQDPGKVFPGKKMAGRMGGKRRTVLSAWLYKVDPERNLLYVKGQVPGHKGNFVLVRDAVYRTKDQPDRPLPTIFGDLPPVTVAQAVSDPFEYAD